MNFNPADKKSISKYLHLHKISDFEKTSQRDSHLRDRSDYAENYCRAAELFIH